MFSKIQLGLALIATNIVGAMVPAVAGNYRIIVDIENRNALVAARGELLVGALGARSYDAVPTEYFGIPVDANGIAALGPVSVSSAAVAGAEPPAPPPVHLNSVREVAYIYADSERVLLDYYGNKTQKEPIPSEPQKINPDVFVADGASESQKAMLGGLFDIFTKPRVDPKREFSLIRTDEQKVINFGTETLIIEKRIAEKMGGPVAEIWVAPVTAFDFGTDFKETMGQVPLAARNRPNDVVGFLAQVISAENGGIPMVFTFYQAPDYEYQENPEPVVAWRGVVTSLNNAGLDDDDFDAELRKTTRAE